MSNPYSLPEEVVVELRRRLLHNKSALKPYMAAAAQPKQRVTARQTKLINYHTGKVSALEGVMDLLGLELEDPS